MGEVLELYKILEEVVGPEKAKKATEAIESLASSKRGDLATKADIQELKAEIERIRAEVERSKVELLRWLIFLFIGQITFIVGLVFTLIKLLKQV